MKKEINNLKVVIYTFLTLIIVWLSMFVTDYYRTSNLKEPIFALRSEEIMKDGGSGNYQGLGYSVYVTKIMDVNESATIESVTLYLFGKAIVSSIQ